MYVRNQESALVLIVEEIKYEIDLTFVEMQ